MLEAVDPSVEKEVMSFSGVACQRGFKILTFVGILSMNAYMLLQLNLGC